MTPYQRARRDNERRVRSGPIGNLNSDVLGQIWDEVERIARDAARRGRLKLYKFFNHKYLLIDMWKEQVHRPSYRLSHDLINWWRARGELPPLRLRTGEPWFDNVIN